jgi:pre-mRNA-splicing factor SPF27
MFLDALPYFDNDLAQHPELAARVDAEIAKELKTQSPPNPDADPRLPSEYQLFPVSSTLLTSQTPHWKFSFTPHWSCLVVCWFSRYHHRYRFVENNPSLAAELQRIQSNEPLAALDTTRYKLPEPSGDVDEKEWAKALENAKAQLEHQHTR